LIITGWTNFAGAGFLISLPARPSTAGGWAVVGIAGIMSEGDYCTMSSSEVPGAGLPLDMLGIAAGTDKSRFQHDYLRHYDSIFARFRHLDITILEIGILGGASLRMWQQYFPSARIVGVDINPGCRIHQNDRVAVEIGSQDDPGFLMGLCQKYQPTIIIDDGSHRADHVIFTFERLFPLVNDGGCYVIEDLQVHLQENASQWRGDAAVGLPEYLFGLLRDVMAAQIRPNENKGFRKYFFEHIDQILFFREAVCMMKRAVPSETATDWDRLETLVRKLDLAENWRRYAGFVQRRGGPLARAEAALHRVVELGGGADALLRLVLVLERQNKLDDAIAAVRRANELQPSAAATAYLDRLVRKRGQSK
jgi:hypothetical protein